MALTNDKGEWLNSRGKGVPTKYVKDIDKKRDRVVERLTNKAQKIQKMMQEFKGEIITHLETFLQYSRQTTQQVGGIKGNVTLRNFSGNKKFERGIAEYIDYDERLQSVKDLIDECITEWTVDVKGPLKTLIDEVFEVDRKGRMNINGLRNLSNLEMPPHPKWEQAMALLRECEQVTGTKSHYRFYVKGPNEDMIPISLDFAKLDPLFKEKSK